MNIIFFCQSCGSRFEVGAGHAGKRARCKHCGQQTTIPAAKELASMTAMPAVPPVEPVREPKRVAEVGAPLRARGNAGSPVAGRRPMSPPPREAAPSVAPVSWIDAVNSRVGLAPISAPAIPALKLQQRAVLDALADESGPAFYAVAEPTRQGYKAPAYSSARPNVVQAFWRSRLGGLQSILRFINNATYLVSIPFLMMVLLGAVTANRGLAFFGATVVVLLNIGRLATGLANLVFIPFRDGIVQGIMFLIPPITFIYMANHWKRLRRPLMRVVQPTVTIGLVFLAFSFVPGLAKGDKDGGPSLDRLKAGVTDLSKEMRSGIANVDVHDLNKLRDQARETLREVEGEVRQRLNEPIPGQAPPTGATPVEGGLGKQLNNVESLLREQTETIRKQP